MSLVGTWVETQDGLLLEVTEEKGDFIVGTEVVHEGFTPVHYGEEISVKRSELIDLEEYTDGSADKSSI